MKYPKLPYIIYTILVCICLFVGCSKKEIVKEAGIQEIEQTNISWILRRENGIENINFIFGDSKYIIVNEDWFKKEILGGFKQFLFDNNIQNYSLRNDCDDFARAFSFYCRVKYRSLGYMDYSPAVGDFYYKESTGGQGSLFDWAHAINIGIFVDNAGNKVVRFIEPQEADELHDISYISEEVRKYYVEHVGM